MAENFDLIFGQNASQQYAWNDTDYQNGWETIGNIPPTAAQFDALQRRADTKAQELNSRLTTVEQSIAGGGGQKREADTTYAVGDVVTYDGLPMDWVLVCIVGGTTGSADIILPSPRVEGARILDGTVTWALRKIATYGGIGYRQSSTSYYTGAIAFSTALPTGWYLECTGTGGTTSASDLVITSPSVGSIVTDGTVTWTVCKVADTTDATTTTHGLMSASDKTKLNSVEANANNYSLPTASASVKGGIKIGSGLSMSGDTLNNAYSYTLPTASASVKGGIKIGSGLSMSGDTLNNAYSYTLPTASASVKGGIKIGSGLSMSGDTLNNAYSLPTASGSTLGGIKIGSGLSMSGDTLNNAYSLPTASGSTLGGVKTGSNITNNSGTISLSKTNVTSALGYTPPTTNTTYSTGTESYSGTTKLYTGLGDNTDGSMTQKAIKAIVGAGGGIVAARLDTNGYVKFANGFCLQWGKITSGANQTDREIIFPVAFDHACYGVIQQRLRSAQTGGKYGNYYLPYIADRTKCYLWIDDLPSIPVCWIAYGA